MTTRPVGMRLELRDWYYNSDKVRWEGFVTGDIDDVFTDGIFVAIHASSLKEVIPMTDVTIFEFKSGARWFALASTKKEDI